MGRISPRARARRTIPPRSIVVRGHGRALGAVLREVVNATTWWGLAAEAGVWSVVIVVMQPVRVGRGSGCIAVVVTGVGPFRGEGPAEPLDFPVDLRPVGPSEALLRVAERGREVAGPVTHTVIGHHGSTWIPAAAKNVLA